MSEQPDNIIEPQSTPGDEPLREANGGADGSPITLRDVLRAVFLPPRGEQASPAPLISLSRPRQPEATPLDQTPTSPDLDELFTPPSVEYVDEPPNAVAGADVGRMAVLGLGSVVTVFIAFIAQSVLTGGNRNTAAVVLYLLAAAAWVALLVTEFARPAGGLLKRGPVVTGSAAYPLDNTHTSLRTRALIGVTALLLSIATYILTADNTFTLTGVIAWLLSVALWMISAAERRPEALAADWIEWLSAAPEKLRAWRPTVKPVPLVALVLILALAAFFRFYRLGEAPIEMTSDHVEKLLDAYDVSQGVTSVFFRDNGGREAIQFYLIPIFAKLLGTGMTFLTLKLVTVVEGLLLIPVMLLLGREVIDRETGLLAAAFIAVSWWHVVLSRLALRIVLTPLLFTLVLVMLVRGIRTGSRKSWLWAGFWMGVGVYGYQAMRMTPLVALAAFAAAIAGPVIQWIVAAVKNRPDESLRRAAASNVLARQSMNLVLSGVVALAIFVPMLRVWHDYPNDLWARVVNRTTESERTIDDAPLDVFIDNYEDALGMFNVKGDVSWISAVPLKPLLDRVAGGLFVLGLLAWTLRLWFRRDPADAFLIAAGLIMLLPSALAIAFPIENPSTTRASGALPIVYLIAAWPLALIRQRWSAVLGRVRGSALAGVLILVLLSGSAVLNFDAYFDEYDVSYRGAALNPGEVAGAVRQVIGPDAPLDGVWLQGWPYWHDYRAIGIEAGDFEFDNAILDVATLRQMLIQPSAYFDVRPLVFIVHPDDAEALDMLAESFPSGEARHYESATPGRDFVLFVVPPG